MSDVDHVTFTAMLQDVGNYLIFARDTLAIIGVIYTTKLVLSFAVKTWSAMRTYVVPRFWYARDFSEKYGGSWAVITGASEGLGRSYARKLAKRGMNVFLVSRNIEKLQKVEDEIRSLYKVDVKCFAMDLCLLSNREEYERLGNEIGKLDVGLLVNNVGIFYDRLQYFLTVPKETQLKIIDLNISATILMTYLVLPYMVQRKNGAIINIASIASVHPTPLMTTYSAAKGFVDTFTRALQYEYSSEGVTFQAVQPGYVSTAMTHHAASNFMMVDPDVYAEHALRTLGVTQRCYGYWFHGLFGFVGELLPERVYMFCTVYVNPVLYRWLTGLSVSKEKSQ